MHHLVFISLEFSAATFSGNGVYARSQAGASRVMLSIIAKSAPYHLVACLQVRSLCGQQCNLLVFSGKPTGHCAPPQAEGAEQLIQVTLGHSALSCSVSTCDFLGKCFRTFRRSRRLAAAQHDKCAYVFLTGCSSWQVELPVWDRLDRGSGWAELAKQAASPAVVQQVAAFSPSAVLGVDWSSLPAYKALAAAFRASGLAVPPFVYMNYR